MKYPSVSFRELQEAFPFEGLFPVQLIEGTFPDQTAGIGAVRDVYGNIEQPFFAGSGKFAGEFFQRDGDFRRIGLCWVG